MQPPHIVQGTISSYMCPRKNGPPAVYRDLRQVDCAA